MMNKKHFKEFHKYSLKLSALFFWNTKVPNRNPRPREIKTAGNSKIPCGNNRHKTKNPSDLTLMFATKPSMYPLRITAAIGKIPRKTPKIIPVNELCRLFRKINFINSNWFIPSVLLKISSMNFEICKTMLFGTGRKKLTRENPKKIPMIA